MKIIASVDKDSGVIQLENGDYKAKGFPWGTLFYRASPFEIGYKAFGKDGKLIDEGTVEIPIGPSDRDLDGSLEMLGGIISKSV